MCPEPDVALRWPPLAGCPPEPDGKPTTPPKSPAGADLTDEELSDDFTAEDTTNDKRVPKFRLELWGRLAAMVPNIRYKKGPEGIAHHRRTRRDHHMPGLPLTGYRFILDVKFLTSLLVGIHYDRTVYEGPRRRLHHRGVSIQSRFFPGGLPVRTRIDLQYGEAYLRWVIRDNARIRLAIGLGAAWASARVRIRGQGLRADGRVEEFFAPTISYYAGIYPVPWLGLWLESSTSVVSLTRFPSLASNFRAGLRFPFGPAELMLAFSMAAGQIEDLEDRIKKLESGS